MFCVLNKLRVRACDMVTQTVSMEQKKESDDNIKDWTQQQQKQQQSQTFALK